MGHSMKRYEECTNCGERYWDEAIEGYLVNGKCCKGDHKRVFEVETTEGPGEAIMFDSDVDADQYKVQVNTPVRSWTYFYEGVDEMMDDIERLCGTVTILERTPA